LETTRSHRFPQRFLSALCFANESPSRVPLADWYWAPDGKQVGFQARSVVGGSYMPLLRDPAVGRKWTDRARVKPAF
jgi:hypothetical protein